MPGFGCPRPAQTPERPWTSAHPLWYDGHQEEPDRPRSSPHHEHPLDRIDHTWRTDEVDLGRRIFHRPRVGIDEQMLLTPDELTDIGGSNRAVGHDLIGPVIVQIPRDE